MGSLGTMIYLVARAAPRIGDVIVDSPTNNKFDKLIASIPFEKIDASFGKFLEKTLRRTRLVLLRIDNALNGYLNKLKKLSNNGYKNGDSKPTLFTTNGNGEGKKENGI